MSINLLTSGSGTTYLDDTGNYTSPAVGGSQVFFPNNITGLLPELRTGTLIRFYDGSTSNGSTNPTSCINLAATSIDVDFTINGAGGLDTGSLVNNTAYYFYILRNTANTVTTIIGSASGTYGGITYPTGYSSASAFKLPFGCVYRSTTGFIDFRMHGWPSKTAEMYYHDIDVANTSLSGGTATTFTAVNLYTGTNNWVPANARRALIQYILTSTGSAVDLYFQNAGSASQLYIASVPATSGAKSIGTFWTTLSSAGDMKYKLSTTGANVTLRVLGCAFSES